MNNSRSTRIFALLAGMAAAGLALTPSLVPRPALFQGFLVGLTFGLSYLGAAWLLRTVSGELVRRRILTLPRKLTLPPWAWLAIAAAVALYVAVLGALTVRWQNEVRSNVEMPPVDGVELATFFAVAVIVAGVVFAAHWGLRKMAAVGRIWASHASAKPVLVKAGGLLTGALTAALAMSLLVGAALLGTDNVFAARNATTPEGISEPSSEFRSAGPESAVEWEKLGMQGRAFVGGGPTAAAIEELTSQPAQQPVRVYVGSEQAGSMTGRAELAVAELKRTGGFNRAALMIATPTGSGWLERQAVDSLEYLHNGDTAIVSMQYSYQPSWVSFLFHQNLPRESAQALYQAVRSEWESMPVADRPKLLVYGLSLGASGMQSAFTDVADLTGSVDGAVFSGAPNNSQPWGTLQESRDPGTPLWQPTFDGGRHVRWLSNSGDFARVPGPWESGRIAYLQHGTDAVTWLTPRLIWEKPEWLGGSSETGGRAPDVSDSMRWIPLVTYLQVAFDMFMGESVPHSHGHNFGDVAVEAWNNVLPSALDSAAVERIQSVIEGYPYEESMTN
ncbi:alpha/beta-hydrolase family protein [Arthrobacter sp. HLT1-20]